MLNWIMAKMAGKKTYTALALLIAHQLIKALGLDISEENLSIAIDTVLAILAAAFRMMAAKREQPNE